MSHVEVSPSDKVQIAKSILLNAEAIMKIIERSERLIQTGLVEKAHKIVLRLARRIGEWQTLAELHKNFTTISKRELEIIVNELTVTNLAIFTYHANKPFFMFNALIVKEIHKVAEELTSSTGNKERANIEELEFENGRDRITRPEIPVEQQIEAGITVKIEEKPRQVKQKLGEGQKAWAGSDRLAAQVLERLELQTNQNKIAGLTIEQIHDRQLCSLKTSSAMNPICYYCQIGVLFGNAERLRKQEITEKEARTISPPVNFECGTATPSPQQTSSLASLETEETRAEAKAFIIADYRPATQEE